MLSTCVSRKSCCVHRHDCGCYRHTLNHYDSRNLVTRTLFWMIFDTKKMSNFWPIAGDTSRLTKINMCLLALYGNMPPKFTVIPTNDSFYTTNSGALLLDHETWDAPVKFRTFLSRFYTLQLWIRWACAYPGTKSADGALIVWRETIGMFVYSFHT